MKKILFVFALVLFLVAQATTQEAKDLSLSIKYYDRTMYYPLDKDTNPVMVHITLANKGTKTVHFKLSDDRMFSIDFKAYTVKNTLVEPTTVLLRKRSTNQRVYFREITLEAGEEYSFIENAKEYLEIKEPSMYYLEVEFYPELYRNKEQKITSNRLNLEIRPSPSVATSIKIATDAKTAAILTPQAISPDKVVEQTIIARQKSLWDQFFLYLDIEEMYKANSINARQFANASAAQRDAMLNQYKADLMLSRIDTDIVSIPRKFEIEKTTYNATQGTVTVIQWFAYETYMEKKRYTYYVKQHDGIWQIYAYNVDNLGTE